MKRLLLYIVLALQVAGLIGLYAYHSPNRFSRGYLLQTRPVDPRDLLRGDYVILSYDIGTLPEGLGPGDFPDDRAYVQLSEKDGFWKIESVSSQKPDGDAPWLAAEVRGRTLVYGIEKYFVPEGQGNPPLPITVEIVIRPGGQAQIRQFFAKGEPWPRS